MALEVGTVRVGAFPDQQHGKTPTVRDQRVRMPSKSETRPSTAPLDVRTPYFTFLGVVSLLIPALLVAGAAFAPSARGPVIAGAFLLPSVLFAAIRVRQRRRGGYKLSTALALIPAFAILVILAGFLLPYAFLQLNNPYLWWIWASLSCPLVLGLLIGFARHDKEVLRRGLARRFVYRDGRLVEDRGVKATLGMRASTGSRSIDLFVRVAWAFYSVIIVLGVYLGGGAAFVLGGALGGLVSRPAELDIRIIIIEIVIFLASGPLGVWLPAFWRMWRITAVIERGSRPHD